MDFDTYEDWAQQECLFIAGLLEKEDLLEVLRTCLHLGKEALEAFASAHSTEIQDFLHTPREKRKQLLRRFREPHERHMFLVAVLYEARSGLAMLESLRKFGVSGSAGTSRSTILLQAAAVSQEVAARAPHLYPFAEDEPFGITHEWFSRRET